jgi:hypothetical protein
MDKASPLHPALSKMLHALYGYAGDEGGVRHANKVGGRPVSANEARLILIIPDHSSTIVSPLLKKLSALRVSICAFVNWLVRNDRIEANPLAKVDRIKTRGKQVRAISGVHRRGAFEAFFHSG